MCISQKFSKIYPNEKCNVVMEEIIDLFPQWEEKILKDFSNDEVEVLRSLFKKAFTNIMNEVE